MKKHSMPVMKEGGVNVTPLIDIVMCLIIFFMLVTKIGVSRGEDKDIALPSAIIGKKIEDLGNTLTLNVHNSTLDEPQITTMIDSKVKEIKLIDRIGGKTDRPLERVLKEFKQTHKEKSKVIIRADKDLPYHHLEQVLVTIATAGIMDTAYETKEGAEATEVAVPATPQ
ncbi:MAG: Biopolymer transport protein ExbD/TolR [Phycisphaerales bacterium]|jgi:biopolymer transport protein ExbD|nr:Biopolymer transport protein ExbD/TolR [Phycisphaerales bacterium]MDB5355223.1 Biopolymer transport protein ExbD/TolR [Phycisphaerales bacterium]